MGQIFEILVPVGGSAPPLTNMKTCRGNAATVTSTDADPHIGAISEILACAYMRLLRFHSANGAQTRKLATSESLAQAVESRCIRSPEEA